MSEKIALSLIDVTDDQRKEIEELKREVSTLQEINRILKSGILKLEALTVEGYSLSKAKHVIENVHTGIQARMDEEEHKRANK